MAAERGDDLGGRQAQRDEQQHHRQKREDDERCDLAEHGEKTDGKRMLPV